jgi:hypothetical protein
MSTEDNDKRLTDDQVDDLQARMQKQVDAEGKGEKVYMADPSKKPALPTEKVSVHIEIYDQDDGNIGIRTKIDGKREDGTVPPTPAAEAGIGIMHRLTAGIDAILREANERHAAQIKRMQNMTPEQIEADKRMQKNQKRQKRRDLRNKRKKGRN